VKCHDFKVASKEHEYIVSPQEASFQTQPLWAFNETWYGTSVPPFSTSERSHITMLRSLDPDTHSMPDCKKDEVTKFSKF
jgi:hypothetical protein